MDLSELIAGLGAYASDPSTQKEVARALRASADTKPIAQLLINAGAGKKTGESQQKLTELEDKITALEDEKQELAQQVEAAQGKPNEQQAAWDREKAKLQAAKDKAEQERDAERVNRKGDAVNLARSRFLSALKGRVDDFGLDALERRFGDRFRPRDDLSGVDVLDDDGDPIEAPKGQSAEEVLAELAFKTVPASNTFRPMNAGGGSNGSGAQGSLTTEQLVDQKIRSGTFSLL